MQREESEEYCNGNTGQNSLLEMTFPRPNKWSSICIRPKRENPTVRQESLAGLCCLRRAGK